MIFIILILIALVIWFIRRKSKKLKLNNLVVVNGGVKSGKTTLSVYLAIKQHKKMLFKYKFRKLMGKKDEMPLLYSNIPLRYDYYIPLTKEVLLNQKRLAFKSICLISEASLVANAQEYKNEEVNEGLLAFCKLYAHKTHGGYCFVETQTMSDLHHQFKKNINNYLYIYTCNKLIPFLIRFKVREMLYNYDNTSIQNNFDKDIEKTMLNITILKTIWKKFDCYTYSVLSDNLDYDMALLSKDDLKKLDLKTSDIISFNKYKYLNINNNKGGNVNE